MQRLHEIEGELGRVRTKRWGDRTIDLDILAAENLILPDLSEWNVQASMTIEQAHALKFPPLTIPHPRLCQRAFALIPLLEIWPDWIHPVYQQGDKELRNRIPKNQRIWTETDKQC
jgi:2-amino-4-hydroxy-6-hydroxymethyldihydropteridine diphosphokinase